MLIVYDKTVRSEAETTGNGLGRLTTARNVRVTQKINGEYYLEFELPYGSHEWGLIENENVVKADGQLYRIKTPTVSRSADGRIACSVRCNHVMYDAEICRHIPLVEEIGQAPKDIMEHAFADTHFEVVNPPGLEWVTDRTDIEQSRMTPFSVTSTLIEKVGGEVYRDNWKIALVKELGEHRNVRFSVGKNVKDIERQVDTSNLCTRLYPYGPENLEIGEVNGGKDYLDSEYIGLYAHPYVRDMDFNDLNIEDEDVLEQLKAQALKKFEGAERIDVPAVTYRASVAALYKHKDYGAFEQYNLGDTVTIYDETLGIETQQRIIEITRYPDEPQADSLTFGTASKTLSGIIGDLVDGNEHFDGMLDKNGNIKTSWLEAMQKNETTSINSELANYPVAKYKYGAIWTDETKPCAVAIINGRLAISNQKRDGDWYWTTIMDAGKVIVNEVFTGVLYTSLIEILGDEEDARLSIKNNLITITEGENTRVQIGYTVERYVFEMYDKEGNKTLYMDEDGNMTLTGKFSTGWENQARVILDENGIESYNSDNQKNGLFVNPALAGIGDTNLELFVNGRSVFGIRYSGGGVGVYGYQGAQLFSSSGVGVSTNNDWYFNGAVRIGSSAAATQEDIADLQAQIDALKGGGTV